MPIEIFIQHQGAPIYNDFHVVRRTRHMVAISIDMHSKYTSIDAIAGHTLLVGTNERSMHLCTLADRNTYTWLRIEGLPKDFEVFATRGGRYTLNVVFLREVSTVDRIRWALSDVWWTARTWFKRGGDHANAQ